MKKHIPNAITCCNLIAGCIAIVFALRGQHHAALWAIVAGAVFDFFDGMTARLLHVSSPIGKELDSLADDVTFGVAPSAILFSFLSQHLSAVCPLSEDIQPGTACCATGLTAVLPYLAFLMAAFSALRLAKFNLDDRQAMGFIGLPTPANALFWSSLIVGGGEWLATSPYYIYALLAMSLVSCYLLVAEIPMFALKFKTWGWQGNQVKYIFLITCVPLLLFLGILGIAAIIAWYVVLSVFTQRA